MHPFKGSLHHLLTNIICDEKPAINLSAAVIYLLSCVQLFATLWTLAHQAPLFMRFPRQEYWSRLPFPSPGNLPNPGTEPTSPAFAGRVFTTEPPGKTHCFL